MNFKEATDALFEPVTHHDLAKALGVSVALIRQARLNPAAKAHRSAPENWRDASIRLAELQISHYRHLIGEIRRRERLPPGSDCGA